MSEQKKEAPQDQKESPDHTDDHRVRIRDEWHCEDSLPEEEELKEKWGNQREELSRILQLEKEEQRQQREQLAVLLKAAGIDPSTIEEWNREEAQRAREVLDELRDQSPDQYQPGTRLDPVETADLDPEEGMQGPSTMVPMGGSWKLQDAGRLEYPDRYGYRWRRNGEGEEDPSWQFDFNDKWLRARAEARGEWADVDFSRVHVYFAYHLTPSASGFLQLSPDQCLIRGEWFRWSKNRWWNKEFIKFWVKVSIEMHQEGQGWISKNTETVWEERNETIYRPGYRTGRYDHVSPPTGAHVNAGDQVTVKMSMTLKAKARSGGSQMIVNFYDDPHLGLHIPGIDWYIP